MGTLRCGQRELDRGKKKKRRVVCFFLVLKGKKERKAELYFPREGKPTSCSGPGNKLGQSSLKGEKRGERESPLFAASQKEGEAGLI